MLGVFTLKHRVFILYHFDSPNTKENEHDFVFVFFLRERTGSNLARL